MKKLNIAPQPVILDRFAKSQMLSPLALRRNTQNVFDQKQCIKNVLLILKTLLNFSEVNKN